jgi:hypothetical protein
MQQQRIRPLGVIGFIAIMLLFQPPPTEAQIDEARGRNWDYAKALYPSILDAAAAGKRDDAVKAIGEFKANLEIVDGHLSRVGDRLHPEDRAWLGSKHKDVLTQLRRSSVAAGILTVKLREVGSSFDSELRDFKSAWTTFGDSFNQLWRDFNAHGKELNDKLLAFRKECRQCP